MTTATEKTVAGLIAHFDREIAGAQHALARFNETMIKPDAFTAFNFYGRDAVDAAAVIFVATAIKNELTQRRDAEPIAPAASIIAAVAENVLAQVLVEAENPTFSTDPIGNYAQTARKAYTARALRELRGGF